ncbi:MAG: F0F1 ATP synthase subunit alpha [Rickettsiales bacterium]|jgi:F-type H+-transporting ATPase subunit alpha|nr:F0F1 ATP synthase subunit alpha [Rickettsiales bacterium]
MEFGQNILDKIDSLIKSSLSSLGNSCISFDEIAIVVEVNSSIIVAKGFTKISYEECVVIDDRYVGVVSIIANDIVKIILLNRTNDIKAGSRVKRTGRPLSISVGDSLVGRVLDGLGRPVDNLGEIATTKNLPIERPATTIMDRKSVGEPLQTGIKTIDSLIPIGKGQRELILGDRQTGKTTITLDTILNQKDQDVLCVYCGIGQRDSSLTNIVKILRDHGAMKYTIVVQSGSSEIVGQQFMAPYTATTIAEYFMEQGKHVLVIYDDLTKHARVHREISLLLEKNPGREAYPADIFYAHARLLERSANRKREAGGGSLTALPIVETESGNISAYIPTNIISITDGQIYLSPTLFQSGILPAIDVGKSVSRIGGAAQTIAYRDTVKTLGMDYSQFEELESFSKFSMNLDESTEKIIVKGKQIREILKQKIHSPLSMAEQVGIFLCLNSGALSKIPPEKMEETQKIIVEVVNENLEKINAAIKSGKIIDQNLLDSFLAKVKSRLGE